MTPTGRTQLLQILARRIVAEWQAEQPRPIDQLEPRAEPAQNAAHENPLPLEMAGQA